MLRTTMTVIAWILGIGAVIAAAYFAFKKWGSDKKKAQVQKWAKEKGWKTAKDKIKAGDVKDAGQTCSRCAHNNELRAIYCSGCGYKLKTD